MRSRMRAVVIGVAALALAIGTQLSGAVSAGSVERSEQNPDVGAATIARCLNNPGYFCSWRGKNFSGYLMHVEAPGKGRCHDLFVYVAHSYLNNSGRNLRVWENSDCTGRSRISIKGERMANPPWLGQAIGSYP